MKEEGWRRDGGGMEKEWRGRRKEKGKGGRCEEEEGGGSVVHFNEFVFSYFWEIEGGEFFFA